MTGLMDAVRVDILLDLPLVSRATELIEQAGVTGYTLLPAIGGAGRNGRWRDDQVTQADSKVLLMTIASADKADAITQVLEPLLDSHGIIVTFTSVRVVRAERF